MLRRGFPFRTRHGSHGRRVAADRTPAPPTVAGADVVTAGRLHHPIVIKPILVQTLTLVNILNKISLFLGPFSVARVVDKTTEREYSCAHSESGPRPLEVPSRVGETSPAGFSLGLCHVTVQPVTRDTHGPDRETGDPDTLRHPRTEPPPDGRHGVTLPSSHGRPGNTPTTTLTDSRTG